MGRLTSLMDGPGNDRQSAVARRRPDDGPIRTSADWSAGGNVGKERGE